MSALRAGLAFAAGSIICQGLRHGVADHLLHLPMAMDLPPGDLLWGAAAAHPTVWWNIIGALGAGSMLVHIVLLVATGAALWRLAGALGVDRWWVIGLLVIGQPALGGVDTGDSLLLPRGAAMPLELLAWSLFVEGRRRTSFALLGLAVCVHAPSAVGLASALAAVHLARRGDLRDLLWLCTSAPVVVPALAGTGPLRMDADWAAIVSLRVGHHVDASTWAPNVWLRKASWLVIAGLAWTRLDPRLRDALLALTAVTLLGGLAWWAKLTLPIQLEFWETDRLATIACVLAAATLLPLSGRWPAGLLLAAGHPIPGALWLLGGQVLPIDDERPFIVNRQYLTPGEGRDVQRSRRDRQSAVPDPRVRWALVLVVPWVALHPPDHRSRAAWGVGASAALEVPAGAVVVVPPVGFEHLRLSGVGLYGTWKDGGEALFDRERALLWKRRMEEVSGPLPTLSADRHRGDRQARLRDHLLLNYAPKTSAGPATHRLEGDGRTLVALTPDGGTGTIAP